MSKRSRRARTARERDDARSTGRPGGPTASPAGGRGRAPGRALVDQRTLLWSALLVGLTLLAYIPALRAGFIWDDDFHITENVPLRTVGGIWTIWTSPTSIPQYYPLVHSLFWLEYRIWGAQPLGYHLVNVVLHGLAAILLWRVLAWLSVPGAWLAGAVFALHPVHVESVAWITERKNVLSAVLYLAALLCFVRYHGLDEPDGARADGDTGTRGAGPAAATTAGVRTATPSGGAESRSRDVRIYFAGSVLFLFALLSKTVAFSLPAAVLLLVWWKRGRFPLRDLAPQVPLLIVGGVFGLMTSWLEKHHVGALGVEWSLSAVGRILVAGRALWFYAGKLLWPHPLIFVYPRWKIDAADPAAYVFPIGFVAVVIALIVLSGRIGRAPAAAVLFFAGTLFPALGFIDVYPMRYAYVADHFVYLASIGLIALVCALGATFLARAGAVAGVGAAVGAGVASARAAASAGATAPAQPAAATRAALPAGPRAALPAAVLAAVLLAVLGVLTWSRSVAYHDAETLWRDTIAKNPDAWMAHDNLGLVLIARGETDAGIAEYREALAIRPDEATVRSNLGIALAQKGDYAGAVKEFTRALEIQSDLVDVRYNLGTALLHAGDDAGAAAAFEEVVRRVPTYAQAHNNLAMVLRRMGRDDEAIEHYRAALRINPRLSAAAFNLASALDSAGRLEEAAAAYASFLKLEPRDAEAEARYAGVLADLGRTDEAAVHARRARELGGAPAQGGAP